MTVEQLQAIFAKKGYVWDANINVVGVRNKSTNKITNKFDDVLHIAYKEVGAWKLKSYTITTDPGRYYTRVKHLSPKGAGRLKEGQYKGVYGLRLHQGKYEALCQTWGNVTVYRDDNFDDVYDENKTETGSFGINIHKAGTDSAIVENWSAGCQVFKRVADFNDFLSIVKRFKGITGNKYTYTLINTNDL